MMAHLVANTYLTTLSTQSLCQAGRWWKSKLFSKGRILPITLYKSDWTTYVVSQYLSCYRSQKRLAFACQSTGKTQAVYLCMFLIEQRKTKLPTSFLNFLHLHDITLRW